MRRYRIYTEDINRDVIIGLIQTWGFDSFTVIGPCVGWWQGESESSIIIEIIGPEDNATMRTLAYAIRSYNEQESVLVTYEDVHVL